MKVYSNFNLKPHLFCNIFVTFHISQVEKNTSLIVLNKKEIFVEYMYGYCKTLILSDNTVDTSSLQYNNKN